MMMNGDDGACWRGGVVRVGNEGDVDNCARRQGGSEPFAPHLGREREQCAAVGGKRPTKSSDAPVELDGSSWN